MQQADTPKELLRKVEQGQQPDPPKNEGDDSPNPLPNDLSELCPEGIRPVRP